MLIRFLLLLGIAISGCSSGCDFPDDPRGTLERVRGGVMLVGVSENAPWVRKPGGAPAGVEVALVRRFAEALDARIEWRWGMVERHLEALKRYELDLVIAGLTDTTPWRNEVGLTRPYFTSRIMVGVPRAAAPGEALIFRALDGVEVAVEQGSFLAAVLEEKDAVPLRVAHLREVNGPIAAPDWQLAPWGFEETGVEVYRERHVMAVPPGENDWLVHLEHFLHAHQPLVADLLRQEVAP